MINCRLKSTNVALLTTSVICLLISGLTAESALSATQISGKLSKRGYTVVALSTSGKAATVKAKTGSFKLRAPGKVVTLQLLDKKGRYAGPIVVGKKGSKAVLGVKRGAKLGAVRVAKGYAKPVSKLATSFVDRSRLAKAKNGVPIGARGFGLVHKSASAVAVKANSVRASASGNAGADPDSDGVANALDIDANGNSVIDAVDANAPKTGGFGVFSQLVLDIDKSVNANASGVTTAQIDEAMVNYLTLVFTSVPKNTELDCNGLSYCSKGGSGEQDKPVEEGDKDESFPACCDSDGDGFGLISEGTQGPTGSEFRLAPRANSSSIHSGDTMTELAGDTHIPGSLGFVFNTVPAVKQLTDGAGNAAVFSYPVAAGAAGTQANPISVPTSAANALTLTFWRPQRQAITGAGETGLGLIDIGQLDYQIQLPNAPGSTNTPGGNSSPQCPQSSFSTSDPNLTLGGGAIGGATDKQTDAAANSANTLVFTLDLASCVVARGGSVLAGTNFHLALSGVSQSSTSVDHADQVIYFRFT